MIQLTEMRACWCSRSFRALARVDVPSRTLACPNKFLHFVCRRLLSVANHPYMIAHGVYSWVPPRVQEHRLEICRGCLTPQDSAYISY